MGTILLEVSIGRDLGALKGLRLQASVSRWCDSRCTSKALDESCYDRGAAALFFLRLSTLEAEDLSK